MLVDSEICLSKHYGGRKAPEVNIGSLVWYGREREPLFHLLFKDRSPYLCLHVAFYVNLDPHLHLPLDLSEQYFTQECKTSSAGFDGT
jgi:hypothetical protein